MNAQQLRSEINSTLSELLEVISNVDDTQFNVAKDDHSWTPAQLTQHLVLSISRFVKLLNGPTEETNRKPDEQIAIIKSIFLDLSRKLKSPDFIIPDKKEYNKKDLLQTLTRLKTELENSIDDSTLNETCTLFEIPGGLGYLTKQEALAFVLYHTQRHIRQYPITKSAVASNNGVR